jgi:hypothetical protein
LRKEHNQNSGTFLRVAAAILAWKKASQNARFGWFCAAFFRVLLKPGAPRTGTGTGTGTGNGNGVSRAHAPCSFQAQEKAAK